MREDVIFLQETFHSGYIDCNIQPAAVCQSLLKETSYLILWLNTSKPRTNQGRWLNRARCLAHGDLVPCQGGSHEWLMSSLLPLFLPSRLTIPFPWSLVGHTDHCHSAAWPLPATTKPSTQAKGACLVAHQEHRSFDSSIQLYLQLKLQNHGPFCLAVPLTPALSPQRIRF